MEDFDIDNLVFNDEDLDDPSLLAELEALTTGTNTSKPKEKSTTLPVKNVKQQNEPAFETKEVEVSEFHIEELEDVKVELTEEDLNDPTLLSELGELTGVQITETITNNLNQDGIIETTTSVITEITENDHSTKEVIIEESISLPDEIQNQIKESDELPLDIKLKSNDLVTLEKYSRLEKVKAATKNKAGDKAGAREAFAAYKAIEERISQISKPPTFISANNSNNDQITIIKNRLKEYKMAALTMKKQNNLQKAREFLMEAKKIEGLLKQAENGTPVEVPPPVEMPVAPSSSSAKPQHLKKSPAEPRKSLKSQQLPIIPQLPAKEEQLLVSPTKDPEKAYQFLIEQLKKQIDTCISVSAYYYKSGQKDEALTFHKLKKNYLNDCVSLESQMAHGQPVPAFHYEQIEYSILKQNLDININDMEMEIISAIGLNSKELNYPADSYVHWDMGWPNDGSLYGDTEVQKKNNDPKYQYKKVLKIERTKAFQRFLERKKIQFEILHYRGFLRRHLSLGKCFLKLESLLKHCELHEFLDVYESGSKRTTGAKLEVKIRIRQPLLQADVQVNQEKWLLIDFENKLQAAVKSPSIKEKPKTPVKSTPSSTVVTPTQPSPNDTEQILEETTEKFENIDLIVSNNVLEFEMNLTQSQLVKKPNDELLLDKKQQIEIKLQVLVLQVQMGKLTMQAYLEQVKQSIQEHKKWALVFKKYQKLDLAKQVLQRLKIMQEEVSEAESSLQSQEVHLAYDQTNANFVAIKQISITQANKQRLQPEILILTNIQHFNIIQLLNQWHTSTEHYLVLEYAAGGELFDKIQPDIGVEQDLAHFYFTQLILGVEYLHQNGISHRDLKPENLLLDQQGNLKIADFGLATVFRSKQGERRLNTICGTPPYVAPEIFFGDYSGQAVDIWSCGIILFVLLLGNTAWEEPTEKSKEFCYYCTSQQLNFPPWNRLSDLVLDLIRNILNIFEEKRFKIEQIKSHLWFKQPNKMLQNGICSDPDSLVSRLMGMTEFPFTQQQQQQQKMEIEEEVNFAFSQPTTFYNRLSQEEITHETDEIAFSQPDQMPLFKMSQRQEKALLPTLNRFFSRFPLDQLKSRLIQILDDFLIPYKLHDHLISFSTVDKRKCPLIGEIKLQQLQKEMVLVYFRKGKGDPLEFKRLFQSIQSEFEEFICPESQELNRKMQFI